MRFPPLLLLLLPPDFDVGGCDFGGVGGVWGCGGGRGGGIGRWRGGRLGIDVRVPAAGRWGGEHSGIGVAGPQVLCLGRGGAPALSESDGNWKKELGSTGGGFADAEITSSERAGGPDCLATFAFAFALAAATMST